MYQALHHPEWRGEAVYAGDLFRLQRGNHVATCRLLTHPQGWELRLVVDGDVARSTVCATQDEVLSTGEEWDREMRQNDWNARH